jgi:MHS family proline/betaine transporter-like MFS transporter
MSHNNQIPKSSDRKIILASMTGNVLEYYDFTLFVFLTPLISPLFFPAEDKVISLIAGLGTYAVGFFMRPFGSLFFGYIGDTWGRKKALTLSIFMMAIPTALIGCLPTYEQIGMMAPLLLIFCRLCQGLCAGGEYNGASIFTVENIQKTGAGLGGSFITSSSAIGSLSASIVASLVSLSGMPTWAWRCAFLAGVIVAGVGFYLRRHVQENIAFQQSSQKRQVFIHLKESLRHQPKAILCTCGIASCSGIMYAAAMRYSGIFLTTFLGWPLSESLTIVMLGTILYILLVPVGGTMADRFGEKKVMLTGAIATLLGVYPIMLLLSKAHTFPIALLAEFLLAALAAWFQSPMNAFMAKLFPLSSRYSGLAFGYTTGMAIFGGTMTMLATALTHWLDNPLAPVLYLMAGAIIGLVAVIKAEPKFPLKYLRGKEDDLISDKKD